ncbi:MAG: hypothetical protein GY715_03770 [Planctomycetes bacterium]|nr:hypothetical protein [Planctomycetota bacterium]
MLPRARHARYAIATAAAAALATAAPGQLRVVNYNVAGLQGDLSAMIDVFEHIRSDDVPGFAVAPHIYVFQEVQTDDVAQLLAAINVATPGYTYTQATYTNDGKNGFAGAQALYFRSDALVEVPAHHEDIYTGAQRYCDRWHLKLLGYDSPDAELYVYGMHLKADPNSSSELTRYNGVIAVRANADELPENADLPADTHIIYAGDMNFYSNTEAGYAHFLLPGPGVAIDPLGSGPWGGSGHALIHTQSPREIISGPLIGGGMDDRFDFQLISTELDDALGLSIIPGTYRSVGNDGGHYNAAINDGDNDYFPSQTTRSNHLADALHEASDHLPIIVDYQLPARIGATLPADFGRVIEGTLHAVPLTVSNTVAAVVPVGGDQLLYSYAATGDVFGNGSGNIEPMGSPVDHFIILSTSAAGEISGTVTVSSVSQGAGSVQVDTGGTIVRAAAASFDGITVVTETTIPVTVEPDTGAHQIHVDVHNVGYDALQALLDVDNVFGSAPRFGFQGGLAGGIGAAPAQLTFTFDSDGAAAGPHVLTASVETSDEDIPGAQVTNLDLTIEVMVEAEALLGDLDGDGDVDFGDLLIVIGQWGPCPAPPAQCPADLNGSGGVGFDDILVILANWSA